MGSRGIEQSVLPETETIADPCRIAPEAWTSASWRNGAGTSEIIFSRPDLVLNRTPLPRPAPFSNYAGFDRLLMVLEGNLQLSVDGRLMTLGQTDFCRFGGESTVEAVAAEDCLVFNVLASQANWEIGGAEAVTGGRVFAGGSLRVAHVAAGTCEARPHAPLREHETLLTRRAVELRPRDGWTAAALLIPRTN